MQGDEMLKTAELVVTVVHFCAWLPETFLLLQNKTCLGKGGEGGKVWNFLGLEGYFWRLLLPFIWLTG